MLDRVLSLACRTVVPLGAATLILAACAADGSNEYAQEVRGDGYAAQVPAAWTIERPPRTLTATSPDGPEAVSIAVFTLAREFRVELWNDAVAELNDVAARVAERVAPTARVDSSRDGALAGRRARIYEIRYTRDGAPMLDEVVFVLAGRREYQLTCRIALASPNSGDEACALLRRSFRVVG